MATPIEMLTMIDNYETSETACKERKRKQRVAEMKANLKKINARAKEIGDILPVVRKLIENGVGNYDWGMHNGFLTNGISHHLGFVGRMPYLFGCEAGGACGSTDCYFDWSVRKWRTSLSNDATVYSLNDFAEKFAETYWVYNTTKCMAEGEIDNYLAKVSRAVEELCAKKN